MTTMRRILVSLAGLLCLTHGHKDYKSLVAPRQHLGRLLLQLNPVVLHNTVRVPRSSRPSSLNNIARRRGDVQAAISGEDASALKALGFDVGNQLAPDFDTFDSEELDALLAGVKSRLLREQPSIPLEVYVPKGVEILHAKHDVKAGKMAEQGMAVLQQAASEPGAQRTASGLVVQTLVAGSGNPPTAQQTVKVHYEGMLVDGTIFDSSYQSGEPIEFGLDQGIRGWVEGLQMMRPGGKAKLTIPSAIAYGDEGSPPVIPAKSTLIFMVELLEVK